MSAFLTRDELNNALWRGDYILVASHAEKWEILCMLQEMGWKWTSGLNATALIPKYTPCYIHMGPMSLCLQYHEVNRYSSSDNTVVAWNKGKPYPKFAY